MKEDKLEAHLDADAHAIAHGLIHSYLGPDHKVKSMWNFYSALVQALKQRRKKAGRICARPNRLQAQRSQMRWVHLRQPKRQTNVSGWHHLFQGDCKPAKVCICHQPNLPSGEFKNSAILVGEHYSANAAANREPCAGRCIDPGNIRRTLNVTHATMQLCLRSTKY
jgi:hypothetical protein